MGFEPTVAKPLRSKRSPYTSSGTEANINDTSDFNLFKQEPLGRIELPSHDYKSSVITFILKRLTRIFTLSIGVQKILKVSPLIKNENHLTVGS